MKSNQEAVVCFSGGADSTLCAALLAEQYKRVHLLTFDRLSFIGAKNYTQINFERLCKVYGKDKFVRQIIPIDKIHKKICYAEYFSILWEFKSAVAALCFTKLGMHAAALKYSIENKISCVADGSVPYMDLYPDQNAQISLSLLPEYYRKYGIEYVNPVFHRSENVEETLYDKGVYEVPSRRGTSKDKQVYYLEQVLLAFFLKYYIALYGKKKYEAVVGKLYENRLKLMAQWVQNGQV